jgi:hypothetical protein
MITCQTFRENLRPGSSDAEVLEHLRHCDACLDFSIASDPDNFFRAIGGDDLVPPGGVDAFVGDVLAQVRSRQTETSIEPRRGVAAWRQLAVAATLAAGIAGATLVYHHEQVGAGPQVAGPAKPAALPVAQTALVTKPIVETYESKNGATIIEVPSDGPNEAKVVMIFDDSLPADL